MKQVISKWWGRFLTIVVLTIGSCILIASTLNEFSDPAPYADKTISSWKDVLTKYLTYRDSS